MLQASRTNNSLRRRLVAAILLGLAPSVLIIGCEGRATPEAGEKTGRIVRSKGTDEINGLRLVSLSPALTQMLCDLGLSDRIVGVGEVDPVAPPEAAPVGHFRQIDYERLLALRPTHLIIQDTHKEPESAKLRTLAERHAIRIVRPELETLTHIGAALHSLGDALGMADEAAALARRTEGRMDALAAVTAGRPRPRVLLVVGTSPRITAAGPGTFLDAVLNAAGGTNAIQRSAILYPELDAEGLMALRPDVIVHVRMPGSQQQLNMPAGLDVPVHVLEHHAALLPSTSVPHIAMKLAGMLHPEMGETIERIASGTSP